MKNVLFAFCIATFLVSCGGNDVESLKPENSTVKGDLKDYFEVVDKDYKIVEDGINHVVNVELKRTSNALPFDPQTGNFSYGTWNGNNDEEITLEFGCELLDKDGNIVQTIKPGESGWYGTESEDVETLMKLNEGETGTLKIKINIENKPVKFRILSSMKESTNSDADNTDETETISSSDSNTSSNDWDAVLDEYEDYIDKYIEFYKKAKAGDMSAATEYASMLESAQSLAEKLSNAQSELTPTQASRFMKLQQKLTKAM